MTRKAFEAVAAVFDQPALKRAGSEVDTKPKPAKPTKTELAAKVETAQKDPASSAKKKPGQAPANKAKVTFYIDQQKMRALRYLALDLNKSYSDLVEESIRDILEKHKK